MPSIIPVITELVPASWSAADVLTALKTHMASGGASTKFLQQYTGTNATVVRSLTDTTPQYSLRATGASTIVVRIEPSGSLSDAGDTSTVATGASADASASKTLTLGTLTGAAKLWLCEWDDAFSLMFKTAAGTSWQPSMQIGRTYEPDFPDIDEPLGRDGLMALIGSPIITTSAAAGAWINTSTSESTMHVSTGIWIKPETEGAIFTTTAAADDAATVGFVRPYSIPAVPDTTNRIMGKLKYAMVRGSTGAPLTRYDVDNATSLAWIVTGATGSTTATNILLPWLRSVTP
jgi:hypothetical protein